MTSALSQIKQLVREAPLAGLSVRTKIYTAQVTNFTTAYQKTPKTVFIQIDAYEHFYCIGINASYSGGATNHLDSPLIRITDVRTGVSLVRNNYLPGNPDFVPIEGNFSPGGITTNAEPYLGGLTEVDYVYDAQTQIKVDFLATQNASLSSFTVDVALFGYSIRKESNV